MKVKKTQDIKQQYLFEAPLIPTIEPKQKRDRNSRNISLLNLEKYLISNPKDYFLVRVAGESMIDENIYDGDYLLVNKSEEPKNEDIVIAVINNEMTVKILREVEGKLYLFAANKKFLPIEILTFMEFRIQGVVKHVIRNV
jgi:DNA polymerase V